MKVSRAWLQTFFDAPLPSAAELADALTFHAFEIESVEGKVLDVKVTANRGHDCLCHFGIAAELSAILRLPLKEIKHTIAIGDIKTTTDTLHVKIDTPLCNRYIAGVVRGVKVGPSPAWLKEFLESIGQRSINNVVDAANFVMFNTGQPLHAFDAKKLSSGDQIGVRAARAGETMLGLDDKEYTLNEKDLVIVDGADKPIGIAGIKGGKATGVDETTTDIILESANFDGVSVRKTAQRLKLRTDASSRFEQVLSPELAAEGMRAFAELVAQIAGGEVVGFVDAYPHRQEVKPVAVTTSKVNAVLGTSLSQEQIADVFMRLRLKPQFANGAIAVTPPPERLDILIPEDLIEEVGRIIGYDAVPETALPVSGTPAAVNTNFYAAEHAREALMAKGYSEIFTSVFADEGERVVLNKVDGTRPFLRKSLLPGLKDAYERNMRLKDLLGLKEVRLFEIGTVWRGGKEEVLIGTVDSVGTWENPLPESRDMLARYEDLPLTDARRYRAFSKYPFIVRDIAMWVPGDTNSDEVLNVLRQNAGELLVRCEKFDEFQKGEKVSYAFRLVFQSFEKTLTDAEVNSQMEKVTTSVRDRGWEVR